MSIFAGELYVGQRLNKWAEWCARKEDSGLGYPKCSPTVRLMPRSGSSDWTPEMNTEACEMDQCVAALLPALKQVIMLEYRTTGTKEQKAKACGCCRMTYHNRLTSAHRDIYLYLEELALGNPLPVREYAKESA